MFRPQNMIDVCDIVRKQRFKNGNIQYSFMPQKSWKKLETEDKKNRYGNQIDGRKSYTTLERELQEDAGLRSKRRML